MRLPHQVSAALFTIAIILLLKAIAPKLPQPVAGLINRI